MRAYFFLLLLMLLVIAILTGQSFIFTILYLLAGAYVAGSWWSQKVVSSLTYKREFVQRVFPKEVIPVRLEVQNQSLLPVVWLRVHDLLPMEISATRSFQQVVTLGPRQKLELTYILTASKRGYYPVGPVQFSSGDLLGLSSERIQEGKPDYLTVYPRVVPLTAVKLPSHSPFGTLRHNQPVYEDPTRSAGKRDYQIGDSLRRIDWKATAAVGRLQVKKFEPSIALETAIFLNLNSEEYFYRTRFDACELAIVTAASIATWVIGRKQSAGLITNGQDPLGINNQAQPIYPRKGRGHLMRVLETLARVKTSIQPAFVQLFRQERVQLSWGTTLVVVTGVVGNELFDEFFQAQRVGLDIVLFLCGEAAGQREAQRRAKRFGIPAYILWNEQDLEELRM